MGIHFVHLDQLDIVAIS